jgi:hypothetical protein
VRRLRRILPNALTILSLLLCLAFVGLWVRGYRVADEWGWWGTPVSGADRMYFGLSSAKGGAAVYLGYESPGWWGARRSAGWQWSRRPPRFTGFGGGGTVNRLGFGYNPYRDAHYRWTRVNFPMWLPTALFATLPLARGALFFRRRRWVREGHCAKCGYDLRATPDRCPECGAAAAGK